MAQPVIVTAGGDTGGDAATAFAAGAATVVAANAATTAETAAETAASAAQTADAARETAWATQDQIADVRADVAALADRFMETLGAVVELINEENGPGPDDGAPEVLVQTGDGAINTNEGDPDKDKDSGASKKPPKTKGDGKKHWWFGDRA